MTFVTNHTKYATHFVRPPGLMSRIGEEVRAHPSHPDGEDQGHRDDQDGRNDHDVARV